MGGGRKLALTLVLLALAVAGVAVAMATHSYVPLFATFLPLVAIPWVLTREEPAA